MDLKLLQLTPPWDWPEDAAAICLRVLTNAKADLSDRMLAAEFGGNPVAAWPDQLKAIEALDALDLLVTLDMRWSATAKRADYVIAPKLGLECDGITMPNETIWGYGAATTGYPAPYAQWHPAVSQPPEGSDVIEEWELFVGLARRLGLGLRFAGTSSIGLHLGFGILQAHVQDPTFGSTSSFLLPIDIGAFLQTGVGPLWASGFASFHLDELYGLYDAPRELGIAVGGELGIDLVRINLNRMGAFVRGDYVLGNQSGYSAITMGLSIRQ